MNSEEAREEYRRQLEAYRVDKEFIEYLINEWSWPFEETPRDKEGTLPALRIALLKNGFKATKEEVSLLFDFTDLAEEVFQGRIIDGLAEHIISGEHLFDKTPDWFVSGEIILDKIDWDEVEKDEFCRLFALFFFINRALLITVKSSDEFNKKNGTEGRSLCGIVSLANELGIIDAPFETPVPIAASPAAPVQSRQTVEEFFAAHKIPISPEELVALFDQDEKTRPKELDFAIRAWACVRRMGLKKKPRGPIENWVVEHYEAFFGKPLPEAAKKRLFTVANWDNSPGANKS
jgi:hypothetical protein